METTKFHQLCGAYDLAQNNFESYKTDCHILSMEIVREESGSQFDPEVVQAFFDVLPLILEVDSGVQGGS